MYFKGYFNYRLSSSSARYSTVNKGDGTYESVKSDSIECSNNGKYVLATEDSTIDVGKYACYSTTTKMLGK